MGPLPGRVIPTRREEPDTTGRDALRQRGRSMERRRERYHSRCRSWQATRWCPPDLPEMKELKLLRDEQTQKRNEGPLAEHCSRVSRAGRAAASDADSVSVGGGCQDRTVWCYSPCRRAARASGLTQAGVLPPWHRLIRPLLRRGVLQWRNRRPQRARSALG